MPRPCHGLPPPDTVPLCPRVAQIDQQKGLLGYELDDMTAKPDFYLMELLHQVVAHSWWPRVLAPSACPTHTHAAAVPVYAVACVCVRACGAQIMQWPHCVLMLPPQACVHPHWPRLLLMLLLLDGGLGALRRRRHMRTTPLAVRRSAQRRMRPG